MFKTFILKLFLILFKPFYRFFKQKYPEFVSKILRFSAFQKLDAFFRQESQKMVDRYFKSRQQIIEEILSDRGMREKLLYLSQKRKIPLDAIYLEAEDILLKMMADPNYHFIDLWDLSLKWVFQHIYEELVVDQEGLEKVKKIACEYPLILVPSHRSHIDYLLLSYIFYNHHLSVPFIAAGENLSFWPMGYIFRKSSAYFIRRSFGEDELYPILFKAYTKHLMAHSYSQEFFIEGTRSRSGKLEKPKTGLLSLFVESFLEKPQKDLYFVPIAISYERVLEAHSYTQESLGSDKKDEGMIDVLKASKHLRSKSGKVYVQFGQPISLQEAKSDLVHPENLEVFKVWIKEFSLKLAKEINRNTLVTAHSVCAALLLKDSQISKQKWMEDAKSLIGILEKLEVPLSSALKLEKEISCLEALKNFSQQGYLVNNYLEDIFQVKQECRAHLNYFKNGMIHAVSDISIAALCLIVLRKKNDFSEDSLLKHYSFFAQLFAEEFINIDPFTQVLDKLLKLQLVKQEESRLLVLNWEQLELLSSFTMPLLDAACKVLDYLIVNPFIGLRQKKLNVKILRFVHENQLLKPSLYLESISRYSVQNNLENYRKLKLIKTHEKELGKRGRNIFSSLASKEELVAFREKLRF